MFQTGKIDLLRNIQRKNVEIANMSTGSPLIEDDVDVETLVRENMAYKKIHTELLTQVSFIEKKMHAVKSEVAKLYEEKKKSEVNENFLKNVLKSLTKVYGFENISKVIANDVEEIQAAPVKVEKDCYEMLSNENNHSPSQMVESNYDEDIFQNEFSQEESSSEQLSTDDMPQIYEQLQFNLMKSNLSRLSMGDPLFMVDFGLNNSNRLAGNGAEYENAPILSKANSYAMWTDDLKNESWNPERQFCHSAMRFMGDFTF
jgi:hypothetical protein